jgi:hypothetical protein
MKTVQNTALGRESRIDESAGRPSPTDAEYEAPVNMMELFDDMEFPASLPELVDHAIDKGASEDVLELLRAMPDRDYDDIREFNRYHERMEELPGQENLYSSEPAPKSELPTEIRDRPIIMPKHPRH